MKDRPILPSRVANQKTGIGVSTIRFSLIMKIILMPNKSSFSTGIPPLPTTSRLSTANSSLSASTGSTPASPSNQLQLQKINNESYPYWTIGVTVVALGIIIFCSFVDTNAANGRAIANRIDAIIVSMRQPLCRHSKIHWKHRGWVLN